MSLKYLGLISVLLQPGFYVVEALSVCACTVGALRMMSHMRVYVLLFLIFKKSGLGHY